MSTLMFIPRGEVTIVSIRFYLSDYNGIWDTDANNVYVDQQLWNQWRDCRKDQGLQRKFFDRLKKVSGFSRSGLLQ